MLWLDCTIVYSAIGYILFYLNCGKEAFDKGYRTRPEGSLQVSDVVLLYNTVLDTNILAKLNYK